LKHKIASKVNNLLIFFQKTRKFNSFWLLFFPFLYDWLSARDCLWTSSFKTRNFWLDSCSAIARFYLHASAAFQICWNSPLYRGEVRALHPYKAKSINNAG